MNFKVCFKCGVEKPLSDFYKHSRMKDGHLNKCKECTKVDTKENRELNEDYYKEYDRNRPNHVERIANNRERNHKLKEEDYETWTLLNKNRLDNYRNKYPNKNKAHNAVNNAIRDGRLFKSEVCQCCGVKMDKLEGHHESYEEDQWLNVIWLCDKCHKTRHKEINSCKRKGLVIPEIKIPF